MEKKGGKMTEKERTYRCLNPKGIELPAKTYPLAPRLNTLDGKRIYFSITGEPDITIPLEKRLRSDYLNINLEIKKSYTIEPVQITDEEMKTADGLIHAICW
jgi:hypothetical protein